MKKVAVYVATEPEWGGSFQYALSLIEALSTLPRSEWQIKVWHPTALWTTLLRDLNLEGTHYPKTRLQRRQAAYLARLKHFFPQYIHERLVRFFPPVVAIAKWQPDLVIAPEQNCLPFAQEYKQLAAIHDLMHIYEPSFPEVGAPEEIVSREKLYHRIAAHCTDILVDSKIGMEHVLENYPVAAEHVHILPFAAPQSLLQCIPVPPQTVHTIPEKFLLYPAQFWMHKNHVRLVEALVITAREYPDIHFVLTGTPQYNGYKPFLDAVASSMMQEKITILNYISTPELAWLYKKARGMIMPSFFGPTNLPPLEAMALRCPIAVSKIYGMPEQCGDAAIYFDPHSCESIASALKHIWSNDTLCDALKRKGAERSKLWNDALFKERFLQIVNIIAHE